MSKVADVDLAATPSPVDSRRSVAVGGEEECR